MCVCVCVRVCVCACACACACVCVCVCVCVLSVALLERQSLVAANRTSCPPGHGISLLTWSGWRNIQ